MTITPALEITLRVPIPLTAESMRARLNELAEAKVMIDAEIAAIIRSASYHCIRTTVDPKTCLRCGHVWMPRSDLLLPKMCPACKSRQWDRPRKWRQVLVEVGEHPTVESVKSAPPVQPSYGSAESMGRKLDVIDRTMVSLTPPPIPPTVENTSGGLSLRERLRQMREQEEQPERTLQPSQEPLQVEEEHVDNAPSTAPEPDVQAPEQL